MNITGPSASDKEGSFPSGNALSRREFACKAALALGGWMAAAPGRAQERNAAAASPGSGRASPATVYALCRKLVVERKALWLNTAGTAIPKLRRARREPAQIVNAIRDAAAFQGWRAAPSGSLAAALNRPMLPGQSVILDFGGHVTGFFSCSVLPLAAPMDAPIRLSLVFGEVLAEVAEPPEAYAGALPRSWLQNEILTIDECPSAAQAARRCAFRYVKITVLDASREAAFGFSGFWCDAVTSADDSRLFPFSARSPEDAALDQAALRTLREGMQTVFEDGPKRDRRLRLTCLRQQAQANYATYRNNTLAKRCLYILAGLADEHGRVASSAIERPAPTRCGPDLLDDSALFASALLDYLRASGDVITARDLWPLALVQLDFTLGRVNKDGLFSPPEDGSLFIDWNDRLDRQAAGHAMVLYGARATQALGLQLQKGREIRFLPEILARMSAAARQRLWDGSQGLFVSGPSRQVSWASQAWMTLAGVLEPSENAAVLKKMLLHPSAEKPRSPYLWTQVVEAFFAAGMPAEAAASLHAYWGGMIHKGADTFWEVFDPENDLASPYGSHLVNSYCHGWSCAPAHFLRRHASDDNASPSLPPRAP